MLDTIPRFGGYSPKQNRPANVNLSLQVSWRGDLKKLHVFTHIYLHLSMYAQNTQ